MPYTGNLSSIDVRKIWQWTLNDTRCYASKFEFNNQKSRWEGPSNGFSILLASLIDIWGSIIRNKFGVLRQGPRNIKKILKLIKHEYPDLYDFTNSENISIVELFRNNLIHSYGLRHLRINNAGTVDWLNIDGVTGGKVMNPPDDLNGNARYHIDCWRLAKHLIEIIEDWMADPEQGIIRDDEKESQYWPNHKPK